MLSTIEIKLAALPLSKGENDLVKYTKRKKNMEKVLMLEIYIIV